MTVAGPNLQATVGEGRAASVHLGTGDASDLAVGPIDPSVLRDPWLVDNALRDRDLGFPLGVMDGFVRGPLPRARTPRPPPRPGRRAASRRRAPHPARRRPTSRRRSRPPGRPRSRRTGRRPRPTPEPTPKPTARPTPEPTPEPTPSRLASFGLDLVSCDGGIVIDWATYVGDQFDHYATLRNTVASIPEAYPPQDGASFVAGTWTRSRLRTSAHDAGLEAGHLVLPIDGLRRGRPGDRREPDPVGRSPARRRPRRADRGSGRRVDDRRLLVGLRRPVGVLRLGQAGRLEGRPDAELLRGFARSCSRRPPRTSPRRSRSSIPGPITSGSRSSARPTSADRRSSSSPRPTSRPTPSSRRRPATARPWSAGGRGSPTPPRRGRSPATSPGRARRS